MVGIYLECREDGSGKKSFHILAPVCQHYTSNHWRQISKCEDFPKVSSCYDYQEIRRERPQYRSKCCKRASEVKCPQHYIEAYKIHKKKPHVLRQPQVVCIDSYLHNLLGIVGWCYLISWHTAEQRICPS